MTLEVLNWGQKQFLNDLQFVTWLPSSNLQRAMTPWIKMPNYRMLWHGIYTVKVASVNFTAIPTSMEYRVLTDPGVRN